MNEADSLPLFAWCRQCQVLPFPPARRANRVRETAERSLAEKDGKALSQAVKKLKRELAARGLGEDAAWEHIFAFHDAVIAEIARIDGRAPPKGCVR